MKIFFPDTFQPFSAEIQRFQLFSVISMLNKVFSARPAGEKWKYSKFTPNVGAYNNFICIEMRIIY